jgi:hypothetical protein
MNRVIAVTATLATAAMAGTMVVAAAGVPAMAAPRPASAHPAKQAGQAKKAAPAKQAVHAKAGGARAATAARSKAAAAAGPSFLPTVIGSELGGGKYVTVVSCHGVDSPPPVTLAKPGTPLVVNGVGPSAAVLTMLQKPNPYKTVYTCTVTVREKVPAKPKPVAKVKKAHKAHKKGCEIATGGPTGGPGGRPTGGRTGCTKPVTLNTGFGGEAPQVKDHHPAG